MPKRHFIGHLWILKLIDKFFFECVYKLKNQVQVKNGNKDIPSYQPITPKFTIKD